MFNENVHSEHVMKCIVFCGVLFGFRALAEHLHLRPSDIVSGTYENGHPFGGKKFVGVGGLVDKTQKLTVHSNYVRDTAHLMRVPLSEDGSCPGSALLRMRNKCVPDQKRLYCYLDPKTGKCFGKKPIGRNTLAGYHKQAAVVLGIDCKDFCGGHAWRHVHVSINANNKNLNIRDAMEASRHASVSAFMGYIEPDNGAEAERVKGILAATGNDQMFSPVCDDEIKEVCEKNNGDEHKKDSKPRSLEEKRAIEGLMEISSDCNDNDDDDEDWVELSSCGDSGSVMYPLFKPKKMYSSCNVQVDGKDKDDVSECTFVEKRVLDNDAATYSSGLSVVHDSNYAVGTQAEFDRLQNDLESFDGGHYYRHREVLDQMKKSDMLVRKARAMVGDRIQNGFPTSPVSRKRPMSDNERVIRDLREQLKEQKRKRRMERHQYRIDLHSAKKAADELSERVHSLEAAFMDEH